MIQDACRLGRDDAHIAQQLARQIKPAALRILGKVAQDIRELKRATEMMRDAVRSSAVVAKGAHRQPPYGARDTIAIEIELGQARRADIRSRIHLHAVDDRKKILAAEFEAPRIRGQHTPKRQGAGARINAIDFAPPFSSIAGFSGSGLSSSAISSTSRQKA